MDEVNTGCNPVFQKSDTVHIAQMLLEAFSIFVGQYSVASIDETF